MNQNLTNNFPKRHDSPAGRFYEKDGIYKPSVTTVLNTVIAKGSNFDEWLKSKTKEESDRIGKEAMEKGTRVHISCESLLKGLPYIITPNMMKENEDEIKMVMGFILWFQENNPEIISTEEMMFHPHHPAAGTCDILCKIDGEYHLIDIKTGNHYNTHGLQLTAYGWLAKDVYNLDDTPKISVLRLYAWRGKPKYDWKEYEYLDSQWTAANILFRWLGAKAPSKLPSYPEQLTLDTAVEDELDLVDYPTEVDLSTELSEEVADVSTPEVKVQEMGTIYRRNGNVYRKNKFKHEWAQLIAEGKISKSAYWKSNNIQSEEEE